MQQLIYILYMTGLMSVTAQHFDYIRTALKTLQVCSENQYKIRGQPRFDKVSAQISTFTASIKYVSTNKEITVKLGIPVILIII